MRPFLRGAAVAGAFALAALPTVAGEPSVWSRAAAPAGGPPLAIGGYSAGCLQGGHELPLVTDGLRVMKPERRRNFGHPELVSFVRGLGARLVELKLAPLAVGDLGQPRGGPAPNGHASHQSGLDVDLWFSPATPSAEQHSVVDLEGRKRSEHWSDRVSTLLKLAASDARVDRIFVNPLIKRELCEHTSADRGWLGKLRPWWGHNEHFHVRLACPKGSPECQSQPPFPAGDGCREVDWWLSPEAAKDRAQAGAKYGKRVGASPKLPQSCQKVALEPAPKSDARSAQTDSR